METAFDTLVAGMNEKGAVDLDRMLRIIRDTQWSVYEFDWERPLEGGRTLQREGKERTGTPPHVMDYGVYRQSLKGRDYL